ncbi:hypothetical protein D6C84_10284 [Aureobasidium pullulans]|uniref:C2H2-type domain-containing protein n=1 Tax=Aureobasidium pullulans TaxID=5580 RepID=A0A4S9X0R4_AURPU|nr:hypothetical protein D6C84_10284 [Aureobasidium pullulans]
MGSEKSGHQDVVSLVKPQQRMFQCTFCTDTFATKFEWTRHETSLHLPLKRFICCPFAPIQKSVNTGTEICAYCGLVSPDPEHIASHNHDYCQSRDPDARIFLRKDHLRQHLRSWEFLVAGLYQLVKGKSSQSRPVSDKELQDQARLLTYGSSSADINTAADHPEWLDLFKKAYSLDVLAFFTEDMAQAPAAEDLEVYHDLGISMPALSQENQAKALFALFSNDGPVPKNYLRFSASPVPLHKALPFETIAGPWPKAGILGEILDVAEWLFQKTLQSQSNFSLAFDPSETWPWLDDSEDRDPALEQMMLPWDDNLIPALGIVGEFQGIGQERFEYVD